MSALPGFDIKLSVTGTPTATTAEATTNTTGNSYQITDVDRRIIDPRVAPVVKENGVTTVQTVTIDHLFGTVTFAGAATAPVTVDYTYLPANEVGRGRSFTLSESRQILDKTGFSYGESSAAREFISGYNSAEVTFEYLELLENLYATTKLRDLIRTYSADDFAVIELKIGTATTWRGFMIPSSQGANVSTEDLVSASMTWMCSSINGAIHFSEVES